MAESNHKVRHVTQDQEAKHKDYTFQGSLGDITRCYLKREKEGIKLLITPNLVMML